jgi:hypothetical protein
LVFVKTIAVFHHGCHAAKNGWKDLQEDDLLLSPEEVLRIARRLLKFANRRSEELKDTEGDEICDEYVMNMFQSFLMQLSRTERLYDLDGNLTPGFL